MRTSNGKRYICLLLAALFALLAGCAAPLETHYFSKTEHGGTAFSGMKYTEAKDASVYADIDTLLALCDEKDAGDKLTRLYDKLYAAYERRYTDYQLANIAYTQAPEDEAKSAACQTLQADLLDFSDALLRALRKALLSKNGAALREHIGAAAAREILATKDMTEREKELAAQEMELTQQYESYTLDYADTTAEVDGKSWTYSTLYAEENLSDADTARIEEALEEAANRDIGAIYLKLVAIRNEMAQLNGYATYTDYAYTENYERDYTPAQAQELHAAMKKDVSPRFFAEINTNAALVTAGDGMGMPAKKQMAYLEKYAGGMSTEVREAVRYLKRYGLYDINDDPAKLPIGFTTDLPAYKSAFIYNSIYDSAQAVSDTFHEFGHFMNFYYNPNPNLLAFSGCYDTAEVHSTSMEMLATHYYKDMFGEKNGEAALAARMASIINVVLRACIEDEFQQYVYAHPGLTLAQINQAYYDIKLSYGKDYGEETHDYAWMYVPHTFTSPCYYISYGTSALTAMHIWALSQTDLDMAIEEYLRFTSFGDYEYGYVELLRLCGMECFLDDGYVLRTVTPAFNAVEEWSKKQTEAA